MALKNTLAKKIGKDLSISLFIYALPVLALIAYFHFTGETPWLNPAKTQSANAPQFLKVIEPGIKGLNEWGFIAFTIVLGIVEFAFGLYDNKWKSSERKIDIVCFVAPKLLMPPVTGWFTLTVNVIKLR